MPCTPFRYLMPNYRRQFQTGGTFFFTVVTAQRCNLFSDGVARAYLRTAISTVQSEQPFDIVAIILLPDHIHCIWTLPENDSDFSARWSCIKRCFTKQWIGRVVVCTAHPTSEASLSSYSIRALRTSVARWKRARAFCGVVRVSDAIWA